MVVGPIFVSQKAKTKEVNFLFHNIQSGDRRKQPPDPFFKCFFNSILIANRFISSVCTILKKILLVEVGQNMTLPHTK